MPGSHEDSQLPQLGRPLRRESGLPRSRGGGTPGRGNRPSRSPEGSDRAEKMGSGLQSCVSAAGGDCYRGPADRTPRSPQNHPCSHGSLRYLQVVARGRYPGTRGVSGPLPLGGQKPHCQSPMRPRPGPYQSRGLLMSPDEFGAWKQGWLGFPPLEWHCSSRVGASCLLLSFCCLCCKWV